MYVEQWWNGTGKGTALPLQDWIGPGGPRSYKRHMIVVRLPAPATHPETILELISFRG